MKVTVAVGAGADPVSGDVPLEDMKLLGGNIVFDLPGTDGGVILFRVTELVDAVMKLSAARLAKQVAETGTGVEAASKPKSPRRATKSDAILH